MKKRHAFAAIAAAVGGYFAGKFVKSDMETVLECSQKVENVLRDHFKAQGKGLAELVQSAMNNNGQMVHSRRGLGPMPGHGSVFSQTEYQRLLTLATMRNKAVHEGVHTIDMEVFDDVFHGISESFRLNHGIKLV